MCMYNLAGALHKQRKYDEAEIMHRRALEGREKVLGLGHRYTLLSLIMAGTVLYDNRKYDEAEVMYRRAVTEAARALGPDHPLTLIHFRHLSMFLFARTTLALEDSS
jgi:tetratricopeptide (TPR) repeat protein